MNTSTDQKLDKGMLNLIAQKLDHGSSEKEVEGMLIRAGFEELAIHEAIRHAKSHHRATPQIDMADNDFLPPLKKKHKVSDDIDAAHDPILTPIHKTIPEPTDLGKIITSEIYHKGLFSGRLRRKDFIMGFLFFFGLGFVFFSIIVSILAAVAPEAWNNIVTFVAEDTSGIWLMYLPFMFAPLTVMLLSLIARRLHNLDLPGWIAFMYLLAFVTPFGENIKYSLLGMHFVLAVLFIVLISKKGHPAPNKHGALPPSKGSIFKRVLGHNPIEVHVSRHN